MPKHIIEFNLPEESEDLKISLNAGKYHSSVFDMTNYLRSKLKYAPLSDEATKIYSEIRDQIWQILKEHEVDQDF